MEERIKNPILPGFYPDPSICRAGEDYYLVTSTFAYFPGVPIFHSRDLAHWKQIGNILDREEQLNLAGAEQSGGIFAPTIRFHEGMFYMITTNINHGGNFIVTAKDPAGPWSNPYFIEGAEGIDPSLFFDDDGKCYYTGTKERREGGAFWGDNEIYIQEVDLKTMKLTGESYALWHGALRDAEWAEGPHLYKKDKRYYIMVAEAGTGHEHCITIASGNSLTSPFKGYKCNPILTHRHLGRNYPIVNVGHGDLVETQNGEWYMVMLASRPYGGYYRNLGRETFLEPVTWEDGWPVVNIGKGLVEDTVRVADLLSCPVEEIPEKEDFNDDRLPFHFVFLRNPAVSNYSLKDRKGNLRIKLAPEKITDIVSPSYVGIRQTSMSFEFEAKMEFVPAGRDEEAGIVILQSNQFHYRFVRTLRDGVKVLQLIRCMMGKEDVLAQLQNEDSSKDQRVIRLRITADKQDIRFTYSYDGKSYHVVKAGVDGRILSSDVAGGFVGNTIGLYCSGNGKSTKNYADFDWITYKKY